MSKKSIRILMFIVIILVIMVVCLATLLPSKNSTSLPKAIAIETHNQPMMGNANAPLKVVVFEDLKCPNCMRFNTDILPKVINTYVNPGKANYTMMMLAFIPGSLPAANAAHCVYAQNKADFFKYVDYIYQHQPPETENWATVPNLMLYATHIKGINLDKLAQCLVQSPYAQVFSDNMAIANKIMHNSVATPAVYINGVKVDPLTWKQFQIVAGALK